MPCAGRDDSVKRGMDILEQVVLRSIEIPALNKWTKVEPVVAKMLILVSFCKVLRRALPKQVRDSTR